MHLASHFESDGPGCEHLNPTQRVCANERGPKNYQDSGPTVAQSFSATVSYTSNTPRRMILVTTFWGLKRPHKHEHPTNHDNWYPPYLGPWNQNVRSLCLRGLWGLYFRLYLLSQGGPAGGSCSALLRGLVLIAYPEARRTHMFEVSVPIDHII